jgi:hypothetical protein
MRASRLRTYSSGCIQWTLVEGRDNETVEVKRSEHGKVRFISQLHGLITPHLRASDASYIGKAFIRRTRYRA